MLFNTYTFVLLFLPGAWLAYVACLRWAPRILFPVVTALSAVFILASGLRSAGVLVVSVAVNYLLLLRLRPGGRGIFTVGIVFNLGYLAYFKYAGFFLENLAAVWPGLPVLHVILPVGISFYTFQKITVLVDRYRGRLVVGDFWDYALFVTFFPQLIAGPIVHYQDLVPQFKRQATELLAFIRGNFVRGSGLFILGLAKKVLLADFFAAYADPVFSAPAALSAGLAWKAAISYSLQIYFDFSGYVDMAIGMALLFGILLPPNFNSPYQATSFVDFWHRWHITLSTFMRDYLYIPLGGSRHGLAIQMRNLLLTMLIGGLWHGAAWGFILWGGLHGLCLCGNHLLNRVAPAWRMPRIVAVPAMFVAATLLWVPFRAVHLHDSLRFWREMADLRELASEVSGWAHSLTAATAKQWGAWLYDESGLLWLAATVFTLGVVWLVPNSAEIMVRIERRSGRRGWLVAAGLVLGLLFGLALLAMNMNKPVRFIYFQF